MSSVVGVFSRRDQAETAVNEIRDYGYEEAEISLMAKQEENNERGEEADITGQNLTDGAATGGTIGGTAGLLAGAGAMAIPGIGPVVAAGPIAAGLSGLASGGLAGALVDYGVSEEEGQNYEEDIRQGNTLAIFEGVESENEASEVANIMEQNGATDVKLH